MRGALMPAPTMLDPVKKIPHAAPVKTKSQCKAVDLRPLCWWPRTEIPSAIAMPMYDHIYGLMAWYRRSKTCN